MAVCVGAGNGDNAELAVRTAILVIINADVCSAFVAAIHTNATVGVTLALQIGLHALLSFP